MFQNAQKVKTNAAWFKTHKRLKRTLRFGSKHTHIKRYAKGWFKTHKRLKSTLRFGSEYTKRFERALKVRLNKDNTEHAKN